MTDKWLGLAILGLIGVLIAAMVFGPNTDTQRQQIKACEHIENEALRVKCITGVKK